MDLSKFAFSDGVYYDDGMVESWDGTKLNLVRQFKTDHAKAQKNLQILKYSGYESPRN